MSSTPKNSPRPRDHRVTLALAVLLTTGLGLAGHAVSHRGSGAPMPRPLPPPVFTPTPNLPLGALSTKSGPVSLNARLDRTAVHQGGDGLVRMELRIRGDERTEPTGRVATDLVVVLDRSGSMDGSKMVQAKASVQALLDQLDAQDRFALVSYSSDVRVDVPLQAAGETARRALQAIATGGGTNMSAGLDTAINVLGDAPLRCGTGVELSHGRSARVVLVSDGLANEGDASPEGLLDRARRLSRLENVVSTVGVGQGFNEFLMTSLADAGTGNFYFAESGADLAQVFAGELGAASMTVASALAIHLDQADGAEVVEVAGYPLERNGRRVTFRPGSLFAGQERIVWVTWRLPTGSPDELALGSVSGEAKADGTQLALALPALPHLTCVATKQEYVAQVDQDIYAEAEKVEGLNVLKQKVARHLAAGRVDEALADIDAQTAEWNQLAADDVLPAGIAQEIVLDTGALRQEAATASPAQQKALAKKNWSMSQSGRRAGSYYDTKKKGGK
ncbi:MAG: VWA domain-containing protein [Acidobacteriota bacterium]